MTKTVTRFAFTPMLGALLLALLGWGGALAQPLEAQPLEPLVEGSLEPSEVTATSATLRISTRIDLACAVVYGLDESFGMLALDQQMGATAHRDHLVVLRGLAPDTEYRYRLQGSAPDGTFYASEIYTFRTPSARAEATPELGLNVARAEAGARIVAASSAYSDAFAPEHAIDGDPASEWSSRGDGDAAFITVELPEPTTVTGFGLWTRTMGQSAQILRFEVVNEAGEVFGPFELPDASGIYRFPASGAGQRFTFRVLESTGGNTGVVELEIFAPASP